MKLFNEHTEKKELFIPRNENHLDLYVCGPTVYDYVHIGNTRPMIVFDVLRRVQEYQGVHVFHVSNYTDVDDKIILAAAKEGVSEKELTDKYIAAYEEIRNRLNILTPHSTPRVTEYMLQIIDYIKLLIDKGFAYEVAGDVYFRVERLPSYGQVSGQSIEDLEIGARIQKNLNKENPLDFTLWKKTDAGIQFDSPWSKGRPGWHTECVVMINDLFKDGVVDIHGGGIDLRFPHHENEEAQSLAVNGRSLANYWMHNQMMNIDHQKMSKSLGNVVLASQALDSLGLNAYRWFMLSTHYRNPLLYNEEVIKNAQNEIEKVNYAFKQASLLVQTKQETTKAIDQPTIDLFLETLNDDLNTANALTMILNQTKEMNQLMRSKDRSLKAIAIALNTLKEMFLILGFVFVYPTLEASDLDDVCAWEILKQNKQFDEADRVRHRLVERGIL